MLLPILPDTLRIPCGEAYPGLIAVVRPMDLEDKARWFDATAGEVGSSLAAVEAVRRQLVTIEGLAVEAADGTTVSFDATNHAHFRALPMALITPIFTALIERTALHEDHRKN
ncbi:MAG TPA: hypothetical protein VFW98_08335 [Gemmatimonadaceae bacterium]|nr:hypothetical protein [Gemmatimonadaceae bacterium]